MGTVKEWREVLVSGAFWGSFMMLWDVFSCRSSSKHPAPYVNLLRWAIAGFFFGLGVTFGFRAFQWPLITVMGPTIIAMVLVSIIYRKKLKSSESNSPRIAG
jgi:hypothetical protein